MTYTYDYPRPSFTVDIMVFKKILNSFHVLLIKRGQDPYKYSWALPGGFVDEFEPLEDAAARELEEETNLKEIHLQQFQTFGNPGRDPRGWTISTVFFGFYNEDCNIPRAGSDADDLNWFSINELPEMAFDHKIIVQKAVSALLFN